LVNAAEVEGERERETETERKGEGGRRQNPNPAQGEENMTSSIISQSKQGGILKSELSSQRVCSPRSPLVMDM